MNKCIDCEKEIKGFGKRCSSCAKKGELNPLWSGKYPLYCIDCGKEIDRKSIRCYSCANKGDKNPMYGRNQSGKNNPMYGKQAWNKDLTKETDERVAKYSKLRSDETKQKLSKARLKRKETLGFINSEEAKQKMRESVLFKMKNYKGPYKDTKPELKMKEILNSLGIPFEHQFRLGNHLFDFHLSNTNILIEVDGDYWHGNPKKFEKLNFVQIKNKQREEKHKQIAKESNFILLRFWENDILNNTERIVQYLKPYIGK